MTLTEAYAAHITNLQAFIAANTLPATTALITQRDALQAELVALNAKIAIVDNPDVAQARRQLQQVQAMIKRPAVAPNIVPKGLTQHLRPATPVTPVTKT